MQKEVILLREIRRQLIHLTFGSMLTLFYIFFGRTNALFLTSAGILIGVLVSFLILKKKILFVEKFVQSVERGDEKSFPGKGAILFFVGALITFLFFQDSRIILGVLGVLVFGDSVATIVGTKIGRHRIREHKTLEGSIAFLVVSFLFLLLLFPPLVALTAAFFGMCAELLKINDNVSIPVVVGIALFFLL